MKILIVGGGGREHALAWKIAQSDRVDRLYALPGNAGIARVARRVPGDVMDIPAVRDFAERERIDLTVIGPESPLIAGLADCLRDRGLRVFGPSREAAQLEGSKVFAKRLMLDAGIPTARCEVFDDPDSASDYVRSVAARSETPIVVKADGEAAGKGVFVCPTVDTALEAVDTIMNKRAFGASGDRVIIEEYLDGPEASFMCFVDGETFVPMAPAQDYKRALDDDQGPNTGGMGSYAPVPAVTPGVRGFVTDCIVKPVLRALSRKGIRYQGVLYVGLALTSEGPKVVEFNARFGDPETQVVAPLLETDIVDVMLAVAEERLDTTALNWYNKKGICVVMASGGYPASYRKGLPISGIEAAEEAGTIVFHAGTEFDGGRLVTSGGRVLGVTALGDSYEECVEKAYSGVERIHFEGAHFRRDIGRRLLETTAA